MNYDVSTLVSIVFESAVPKVKEALAGEGSAH
jgi:hypothetical protein